MKDTVNTLYEIKVKWYLQYDNNGNDKVEYVEIKGKVYYIGEPEEGKDSENPALGEPSMFRDLVVELFNDALCVNDKFIKPIITWAQDDSYTVFSNVFLNPDEVPANLKHIFETFDDADYYFKMENKIGLVTALTESVENLSTNTFIYKNIESSPHEFYKTTL